MNLNHISVKPVSVSQTVVIGVLEFGWVWVARWWPGSEVWVLGVKCCFIISLRCTACMFLLSSRLSQSLLWHSTQLFIRFFRSGMKLGSCLLQHAKWCGVNVSFMGEQFEELRSDNFQPFIRVTPTNNMYKITGEGSTSSVMREVREGGKRPLRTKIYVALFSKDYLLSVKHRRFGTATVTTAPGDVHHCHLDTWDRGAGLGSTPLPQGILKVLRANLCLRGQTLSQLGPWKDL